MSAHTHSHAPVPAASTAGSSYHYGGRLTPDGTVVDPIVVEIVQGSLMGVLRCMRASTGLPAIFMAKRFRSTTMPSMSLPSGLVILQST